MVTDARPRAVRPPRRKRPTRHARLRRLRPLLRPLARGLRRADVALLAAPLAVRIAALTIALVVVWSVANWTYQVIRKPSELFFPVSGTLTKSPPETWR